MRNSGSDRSEGRRFQERPSRQVSRPPAACYPKADTGAGTLPGAKRIERDDAFYEMLSSGWGEALKNAFKALPPYTLD